jgi:hypothetical protein
MKIGANHETLRLAIDVTCKGASAWNCPAPPHWNVTVRPERDYENSPA